MNKVLTPLEALEIIKNAPTIYVGCGSDIYTRYSFEIKIIENALKDFEMLKIAQAFKKSMKTSAYGKFGEISYFKCFKAIKIIKEKGVCMFLLEHSKNADEYNDSIDNFRGCDSYFNKEEFDLLREVFK